MLFCYSYSKEFWNCRLRAAGIRCPAPILLRLHVLVMEFIGNEHGTQTTLFLDVRFHGISIRYPLWFNRMVKLLFDRERRLGSTSTKGCCFI